MSCTKKTFLWFEFDQSIAFFNNNISIIVSDW